MPQSVSKKLEEARQQLLDLTSRNRSLNIPKKSSSRNIHIHDELTGEIYRLLVDEKKSLTFKAAKESGEIKFGNEKAAPNQLMESIKSAQSQSEPEKRHLDGRLQTELTSEVLQRRLLQMYYDARTYIEEQGINILYITFGQLKWFENETSEIARYAPLIFLPVALERRSAKERFFLSALQDDAAENLSLSAKLRKDFGIILPDFDSEEDFDPIKYLKAIADIVGGKERWEVLPNAITVGFFSFTKFLMYRDLDAENWPKDKAVDTHEIVVGLMQNGFHGDDSGLDEHPNIDQILPTSRSNHILDADSSQALAIEQARSKRHLVIHGPPGTGKSQTIANIIAASVIDGRRVLFVAEKLAALEVVKRRLDNLELGAMCLELHSQKSNKRVVLEELKSTLNPARISAHDTEDIVNRLTKLRDKLNAHAKLMHARLEPSNLTPYVIIGNLMALANKPTSGQAPVLEKPETWTRADKAERESLIQGIVSRIKEIGLPDKNLWRGVTREAVLRTDVDRIRERIVILITDISSLGDVVKHLSSILGVKIPQTADDILKLIELSKRIANAPAYDPAAISDSAWSEKLTLIGDLPKAGKAVAKARTIIGNNASETAWTIDLSDARLQIRRHGRSIFRLLRGSYRQALAQFQSVLVETVPKSYRERLVLLDALITGKKALEWLRSADRMGRAAFGSFWQGTATDWTRVESLIQWVGANSGPEGPHNIRIVCSRIGDRKDLVMLLKAIENLLPKILKETEEIVAFLQLDFKAAFGIENFLNTPLLKFQQRLIEWRDGTEELSKWIAYCVHSKRCKELGLRDLIWRIENGGLSAEMAPLAFNHAYYDAMLQQAITLYPMIGQFDGASHDRVVDDFQRSDIKRIELARAETRAAHSQSIPKSGPKMQEMGIIRGEIARRRGHMPIRKLLRLAGSAVQAIKPVFMMSPLSIAQFLEPGTVEFDIVVIDEASQVEPVSALGAIARGKQLVVVGDDRQLPPTHFFQRMTNDDDDRDGADDDDQIAGPAQIESILGLCIAKGMSQAMLRWHYRSKHHSLITVSNKEFYNSDLFVVPSPWADDGDLGLKFNHVPSGVFDRGGSAANAIEAKEIAKAILNHARMKPDLSLGVVAFSIKQKQAILDELELLRQQYPEIEAFISLHSDEPFFVKNLENIQGDERDVIYISIGYGRDPSGYMTMHFGPVSQEGGERRLNVLISRAKKRCEVFSSITADDIDLNRGRGRGVAVLKTFLNFARTGRLGTPEETYGDPESPFEEAVKRALESEGYDVRSQIGSKGFFVDLAVKDPSAPGRFLIGIECDGAAYHSSRSARDRDRLRQAVLEDNGWVIHRIWSTDWYQRPQEQLRKTVGAIEAAKARQSI